MKNKVKLMFGILVFFSATNLYSEIYDMPSFAIGYNLNNGFEASLGIVGALPLAPSSYVMNPFFWTLDFGLNTTFSDLDLYVNLGLGASISFVGYAFDLSFVYDNIFKDQTFVFRPGIMVHLFIFQVKYSHDIDLIRNTISDGYLSFYIGVL